MSKKKGYPSDLTDAQWEILKVLFPKRQGRGRPPKTELRRVLDAIFYIARSGCQWRMLPADFPNYNTVFYYFSKWQRDGTLEKVHDALREMVRQKERPTPRHTASVDSQSTDSHGAHEARAFDGGKRLDGRKRHVVVDSLGLLLAVVITAGDVSDAKGAIDALGRLEAALFPEVTTIYGDKAYAKGGFPEFIASWKADCSLHTVSRPEGAQGYVQLPIRWVVERTFAWLTKNRRLCRSYEHTCRSEVAFIHVAMICLMTRRLAKPAKSYTFGYRNKAA